MIQPKLSRRRSSLVGLVVPLALAGCVDAPQADSSPDGGAWSGDSPSEAYVTPTTPACVRRNAEEYRALGFEPVTAHGATPDHDEDDDGPAIQRAIAAANLARRVVFFPPGIYAVGSTVFVRQDRWDTAPRVDDESSRYGQVLQGSTCGGVRPTLRLKDGVASETDPAKVAAAPYSLLLVYRYEGSAAAWSAKPPFDPNPQDPVTQDGGRAYGLQVRNLHLVVGRNPGAVGLRMQTAEGSSIEDVSIDASGGFAGLFDWPGSGGLNYRVEVIGGRHALWSDKGRGGASGFLGLVLREQTETPIVLSAPTHWSWWERTFAMMRGPLLAPVAAAK